MPSALPCSRPRMIGRHPYLSRWQWESADDLRIAREALALMDIADAEAARRAHPVRWRAPARRAGGTAHATAETLSSR